MGKEGKILKTPCPWGKDPWPSPEKRSQHKTSGVRDPTSKRQKGGGLFHQEKERRGEDPTQIKSGNAQFGKSKRKETAAPNPN